MPLEAKENPRSLPFIDRPNVRDSCVGFYWCGYDHRENEKVILLSFIFTLFYI